MNFKSLALENFQSYENVSITFSDYKITYITGINQDTGSSNGVGKSGIKEAMFFLIFGRSKVKGGDLIRRGQKALKVSGILEHNKFIIEICRTRKAATTSLEVIIDGVKQVGTTDELQKIIESTLNIDLQTFITYSVIDKVRDTDISKLSSTELRLILQDLLGLNGLQELMASYHSQVVDISKYLEKVHLKFFPSLKRKETLAKYKEQLQQQQKDIGRETITKTGEVYRLQSTIVQIDSTIRDLKHKSTNTLSTVNCPTCGVEINIDARLKALNDIQVQLDKLLLDRTTQEAGLPTLQAQIESLQDKSKAITDTLYRCLRRTTQLEESMKDQADREGYIKEQSLYSSALKVLQDYVSLVLTDIAVKIEDNMNIELNRFSDLMCKINLTKTTNSGIVVPSCSISIFRGEYEYTYDMLSSGEQALVSLLFKLVISNLRGNTSVLFVDEGLDTLDAVNRERILSLLEVSPYNQIFLISHREDAEHIRAGQRILLRKEHGITQIITA